MDGDCGGVTSNAGIVSSDVSKTISRAATVGVAQTGSDEEDEHMLQVYGRRLAALRLANRRHEMAWARRSHFVHWIDAFRPLLSSHMKQTGAAAFDVSARIFRKSWVNWPGGSTPSSIKADR